MHYKLVVTNEMDRLLDARVGYLMKEFMSAFHYREAKVNGMDYILVYKIIDDTVYILGLFHSLENYSRKMQLIWGDNWS